MISGRLSRTAAALLGAICAWTACGQSAPPCTECPPMEGRYTLVLQETGVPSSCSNLTVSFPTGPLDVERVDSQLTATLGELTFQGTLYATSDFTLLGVPGMAGPADGGTGGADGGTGGPDGGSGRPESVSLTGRYIPASEENGGVPQLMGTYVGSHSGGGGGRPQRCTVTRSFTATRQ